MTEEASEKKKKPKVVLSLAEWQKEREKQFARPIPRRPGNSKS